MTEALAESRPANAARDHGRWAVERPGLVFMCVCLLYYTVLESGISVYASDPGARVTRIAIPGPSRPSERACALGRPELVPALCHGTAGRLEILNWELLAPVPTEPINGPYFVATSRAFLPRWMRELALSVRMARRGFVGTRVLRVPMRARTGSRFPGDSILWVRARDFYVRECWARVLGASPVFSVYRRGRRARGFYEGAPTHYKYRARPPLPPKDPDPSNGDRYSARSSANFREDAFQLWFRHAHGKASHVCISAARSF